MSPTRLPKGQDARTYLQSLPSPEGEFTLGEPLHSQVYKGKLVKNNLDVAIKIIDYCEGDIDEEEYITAEVVINEKVAKSQTEGLSSFYRAFRSPWKNRSNGRYTFTHSVILVHELCEGGSIADYAAALQRNSSLLGVPTSSPRNEPLPESAIAYCCSAMLQGLKKLHEKGFVHRDVKGANVLFNKSGQIRLSDFGVSTEIATVSTPQFHAVGTAHWMAPEMCACELPAGYTYDDRVDIWGVGIVALELAEGRPPNASLSAVQSMMATPSNPPPRLSIESAWSSIFHDFLSKCLVKDYEKRPRAVELLKHPFVSMNKAAAAAAAAQCSRSIHFGHVGLWAKDEIAKNLLQERRRSSKKRNNGPLGTTSNPTGAVSNLAALEVLTEETMMDCLRKRLVSGAIYSYVGDVLVSINPFAQVPLYGPDKMMHYGLDSPASNLEDPHIFAIALSAYRSLARTRESQACVISGESGAGKTETAKYFVGHLLDLSRSEQVGLTNKYEVLQFTMNSLLEPFGNAQMVANHNSSRFGKYVGIQFDPSNEVIGACMDHYLLEKSRVVSQLPGEYSFHIFYYVLDGLDQAALTALSLSRDISQYAYLNGGSFKRSTMSNGLSMPPAPTPISRKASRSFNVLIQQMLECGFQQADLDGLYAVLAVVLHLGNIDFNEEQSKTSHYFDLNVTGPIDVLSSLIGCAVNDLANALVTNIMVMRGETIVLKNTVATARGTRDAVAKACYSRLFSWLVNYANGLMISKSQTSGARPAEIGVLDIFGFESLFNNSIEQLCINVANEQLQNFFNASIFAWQADALRKEGIVMDEVAFTDNTETMQLFVMTPMGLFALLDEETRFPNATDSSLLDKFNHNLVKNPSYKTVKGKDRLLFAVNHYAGTIEYNVSGWLEKNKDTITPSITSLFRDSKISLVAELFSLSQTSTGGLASEDAAKMIDRQKNARALIRTLRQSVWKKSGDKSPTKGLARRNSKRGSKTGLKQVNVPKIALSQTQRGSAYNSLTSHFKASLIDLMNKLLSSNPHFVRCIRPNSTNQARSFETPVVLTQLRHTGLLETVKIRRDGYSSQIRFADFITRYRVLNHRILDLVPETKDSCEAILMAVDIPSTFWQLGRSKVFLKQAAMNLLMNKLEHAQAMAAQVVIIAKMMLANRKLVKARLVEAERAEIRRREREREKKLAAEKEAREAAQAARREAKRREEEALKNEKERQERETAMKAKEQEEAHQARENEMEAARAAATFAAHNRLDDRRSSGTYGFSSDGGSDTEYGFGSDTSHVKAMSPKSSASSFGELADIPAKVKKRNKKRGSTFFKKRTPAFIAPMPDEDVFWDADLNMQEVGDLSEECLALCRYKNILPNPNTIVRLRDVEGLTDEEQDVSKFINANYICDFELTNPKKYIATQGPKPSTVDHFWRMVWQHNTSLIVMVTGLEESGRIKCHKYWPTEEGESTTVEPSQMKITNTEVDRRKNMNVSLLTVEFEGSTRLITHIQFVGWPDQGVPKNLKDLTETVELVRDFTEDKDGAPIVVHCSAGVGRTGVIIAADMGIDLLSQGNSVDVFEVLLQMRKQRTCMIQTYEQLELVYRIIARYAKAHKLSATSVMPAMVVSEISPPTSPSKPLPPLPPQQDNSSDIHEVIAQQAVEKAASVSTVLPPGYVHPSQVDAYEGAEDDVPDWRQRQKEAMISQQDEYMQELAETGKARSSTRYFAKRELERTRRNSAIDLIAMVENLPEDGDVQGNAEPVSNKKAQKPKKKGGRVSFSPDVTDGATSPETDGEPSNRKRRMSRRLSKREKKPPVANPIPQRRRRSSMFRKSSAPPVSSPTPQRQRRSSMWRKKSEPDPDSDSDADENIADDDDTLAFLAQLEANRAQRSEEEEARKRELAEQFRKEKAERDRLKALEIAEIEKKAAEEAAIAEAEKDKAVDEAMSRMAELTFDFSFGT